MVTPELLKTVVEQLPLIYDEPFADASQIPTVLLSQMTARHVPVALSGDGGDELFAGYTRHAQAQRLQLLDKHLPARMKAWGANILRYLPPEGWDSVFSRLPFLNQLSLPGDKLYKLSRSLEVSGLQRYSSLLGVDSEIGSIFASPVYCDPCGSLLASWQSVACYQEPLRTQLMDRLVFLPDDVLHKVDRASMAYGLEVRVPLLDSAVLDFADALPSQFNLYAKQTKAPLRQVLAHYAPESLFERPKAGFSVPIASWLRGELKDWAEALLAKDLVLSQGYFDPDKVWALWLQLLEGKGNQHKLVWNILMFQAWLKQWQGSIKH
jgi:asparagine synthase (glutamine-hydrolysing)